MTAAKGRDAIDPATGLDLPDRTEYDLTLDYKIAGGFLRGFWFRARANWIDVEKDGERVREYRLILNYPFRVF